MLERNVAARFSYRTGSAEPFVSSAKHIIAGRRIEPQSRAAAVVGKANLAGLRLCDVFVRGKQNEEHR